MQVCLNLHYMKKISQKLRNLRDTKGYTQEYIAENMGVSPSTVSRIETDCSSAKVEQIQAYCDILDITLGELFADDASGSKQNKISFSISLNVDSQEDLNRVYEAFKILGHQ